ncbi:MAG: S-layer homology domain-containing protein, partial [Oscillospiraceae bacterium]|nr:S-layer homology domain-containing protein [Oscillospiraceae bacterium]
VSFYAVVIAQPAEGNTIVNVGTLYRPDGTPEDEDEERIEEGDRPWRQAFLIGRPDGTIRPRDNITRAEIATIFFRLIEDEVREEYWMQSNPFNDVALERWFNNAISTTVNMGLFQGIADDLFFPEQDITRGELATVLVRFMAFESIGPFALVLGDDQFNDIADHWARAYINRAAEEGWVEGSEGLNGRFRPGDAITRMEAAAMINRMFQRLVESPECLLEGMVDWPDNANPNLEEAWYFLYIQMATNSYTYRWRSDSDYYKELLEIIPPRAWHLLERPNSQPGDIFN